MWTPSGRISNLGTLTRDIYPGILTWPYKVILTLMNYCIFCNKSGHVSCGKHTILTSTYNPWWGFWYKYISHPPGIHIPLGHHIDWCISHERKEGSLHGSERDQVDCQGNRSSSPLRYIQHAICFDKCFQVDWFLIIYQLVHFTNRQMNVVVALAS